MKNNRIFSGGLIKEGIRQLRAVGIAFLCVTGLVSLFQAIEYVSDAYNEKHYVNYTVNSKVSMDNFTAYAIGFLAVYVVIPVLGLMIFNFLNSRSASDYYHSIPQSRVALALSFAVSASFWYFIPILLNLFIQISVGGLCGLRIMWAQLGMYLLSMTAMFIHLFGIILLAVSVATGILNQIAATAIIAFLPRTMMALLGELCEGAAPVLMGFNDVLGRFGEYDFNLILSGIFDVGYIVENTEVMAALYSVLLGIIYCALGVLCFARRKSEAATTAGANKYVQCAIRVLAAFVVCLPTCYIIGENLLYADGAGDILAIVFSPATIILYGFAIIAYFLYEAITARKIKGVITLKGTMGIGLLALVLLNAMFVITPVVYEKIALAEKINTDTVESISPYVDEETAIYSQIIIRDVEFDSQEIIEMSCDILEGNVKDINNGNSLGNYERQKTLCFNMKDGRTLVRVLYMDDAEYNELDGKMIEDEDYVSKLRALPDADIVNDRYAFFRFCNLDADEQQIKELYSLMLEEFSHMSDEMYSDHAKPYYSFNDDSAVDYLNIDYSGIKEKWYLNLPISPNTPKTYKRYIELCNEAHNKRIGSRSMADMYTDSEYFDITISTCSFKDKNGEYEPCYQIFYDYYNKRQALREETKEILAGIDRCKGEEIDTTKELYQIYYYFSIDEERDLNSYIEGCVFVQASELEDVLPEYDVAFED